MILEMNNNSLQLLTGDITKLDVEAIVNAANGSLLGGGGVDGAIHRAAGPQLLEACKYIREKELQGEYLPTGEVVLTKGYNLLANYVIHTVGPIWNEDKEVEQRTLLANCYQNALQLANRQGITSIAFFHLSQQEYTSFRLKRPLLSHLRQSPHFYKIIILRKWSLRYFQKMTYTYTEIH